MTTRMLILGGTRYLGRALAENALAVGWQVTCFNRGRSGRDVPGTQVALGDRTNLADLDALAARGPWDATVDSSAYQPPAVASAVDRLRPVTGRYVLILRGAAGRTRTEAWDGCCGALCRSRRLRLTDGGAG